MFQRYFLLTCVGLAAYCQTPVEPINPSATVSGQIAGGETRSYSFRSSRANSFVSRPRKKAPISA